MTKKKWPAPLRKATLKSKRVCELVAELEGLLKAEYADSEFEVYEREEDQSVFINAYTDRGDEEALEIIKTVSERTTDILLDEGYFIGVIPLSKRYYKQPKGVSKG